MSEKKRGGRPSKLTPETQEKILELLRIGNYREIAVKAVGISYRTFREWMTKGKEEEPDGIHAKFLQAVIQAETEAETWHVKNVRDAAATKDAKLSLQWLERKAPERWSRNRGEILALQKQVEELTKLVLATHGQPDRQAEEEDWEAQEATEE